jgi:hypothetical protein
MTPANALHPQVAPPGAAVPISTTATPTSTRLIICPVAATTSAACRRAERPPQ